MILWLSNRNADTFKCIHSEAEYENRLNNLTLQNIFSTDTLYVLAHNQSKLQTMELSNDIGMSEFSMALCMLCLHPDDEVALFTVASYINAYSTMQGIPLDLNSLITNDRDIDKVSTINLIDPKDGVLSLPIGVNMVEQEAYKNNMSIRSLKCSKNLWFIGAAAFRGCRFLEEADFGSSLMQVSTYAFYDTGLQSLKCPMSLRTIDNYAFAHCEHLIDVKLNDGLLLIDSYAFNSCYQLVSISIPMTVECVYTGAFSQCYGLLHVDPIHAKKIENHVFFGCRALNSIEFTSDVEYIGGFVLQECDSLKTIKVSSAIEDISKEAFLGIPEDTKIIIMRDSDIDSSIIPLRLYQMGLEYEVEQ